jgi:hypothetical protein
MGRRGGSRQVGQRQRQGCEEAEEGRGGPQAITLSVRATPPVHAARSGLHEDRNFWLSADVSIVGRSNICGAARLRSQCASNGRSCVVFLVLQDMVLRV